MTICLKCKQPCDNDNLTKCPNCNGELISYNKEKYNYYLESQKQLNSKYESKQHRMYKDIHTIKSILLLFTVLAIVAFIMMG